ncbi:hypothetical protein BX616_006991, partial [Lobosporangium transversale]
MNRIDLSLDEIIKTERQEKKKSKTPAATTAKPKKGGNVGIQTKSAAIRTEKGIKTGKAKAKASSPYARPAIVKKETALFTESYKAATAPVTQIFTAGYIPKPATSLKLFTTNYKNKQNKQKGSSGDDEQEGIDRPMTTAPLRLVTTQSVKRENVSSSTTSGVRGGVPKAAPVQAQKLTLTTNHNDRRNLNSNSDNGNNNRNNVDRHRDSSPYEDERIPTGPRNPGGPEMSSSSGSRGGDYYRSNERNDRGYRNDRDRYDRFAPGDRRGSGNGGGADGYNEPRGGPGNSNGRGNNNNNSGRDTIQRRGVSPRASEQRVYQDSQTNRPQQSQQHHQQQ